MTWTLFWDMNSGGGTKEPYDKIFIEAPEDEAVVVFYNQFGHNPNRVSCTCCGEDYSISEEDTLEEATGFHRNLRYVQREGWDSMAFEERRALPEPRGFYIEPDAEVPEGFELSRSFREGNGMYLDEYLAKDSVLVIRAEEITNDDRSGEVPDQGFVWVD